MVAVGQETAVGFESSNELFRYVIDKLPSAVLQDNVYFAVGAHVFHEGLQAQSDCDGAEDFTVVDEAFVGIVDDDLEAQVGLFPHEHIHFVAVFNVRKVG